MRRFSTRTLLAAASAALAAVLLIAGGLALWGSAYVHNTVQGQLASQQIFFPPAAAFAHAKAGTEITPSMIPSVSQYAGQQMLTGQQAEAYADHFIAVHIQEMGAGKTYSQLSAESIAQPTNTKLATTVSTVFKGETLRSMLLNAYGWWKVSQITYIISLAAFGLGGGIDAVLRLGDARYTRLSRMGGSHGHQMDREAPSISHSAGRLSGLRFTNARIDLIYMRICPI